jgi:hypothetical protein
MLKRTINNGDRRKSENAEPRARTYSRYPVATAVGSAIGAAAILGAAQALGAGVVGFATSVAVGMIMGGWVGRRISRRRSARSHDPVRQRRTIRILRITRTMRRRNVRRNGNLRPVRRFPRLMHRVNAPTKI